jgi:hypothetical protein
MIFSDLHVFYQFKEYHRKILLRDLNAKLRWEDIFKPTVRIVCLHEISNDNGVTIVNFAKSRNVIVTSTSFHTATFINTFGLLLTGTLSFIGG